ncbi:hypothetical protein Tco_0839867 [Tanacetum coccineum]|uniref:Uncharacterized protein n=1 Tax=Tanacetum coccineum TaxID=301880 RepID=A0ABQ5ARW1_9ASTR
MNTTKEQQKELDDALVAPKNRLKIRKSHLRLSSTLKSKKPTFLVVLDALKLTPFYNAFKISADVPEIYMQEFWVTVTRHHSSLRFKLNSKSHTINVDTFRDMLKICPKLPGQKFEEPTLEEDILSFIRDLGHTGEIKFLSDVNVNHMHQPWRSFAAIINKCLSGKTTALENLVFQVENKNSKKNNDMYYPHFTKVIVDYFMAKDQAIPRRNKMFWHYARDDFMFTTIRVISKHKDTQEYDAIIPQRLTNQAMLDSEAFKTYRAYATGEKAPKSKATKKKTDYESSPKIKPDKPATTKSKGLTVLSEVALSEAEQMKLATKRSMKEFHISHASGSGDGVDILSKVPDEQQQTGSGINEGAGDKPEVPDVPEYRSESEEESWTFSQGEDEEHDSDDDNDDNADEDDDQENDSQRTELDDKGDNFVHPNLLTYRADDQEKEKREKADDDNDDVTSNKKVSTPSNYELTEEDENQEDDDTMGEDQEDDDNGELVSSLESDLSEHKQTNQFVEALASIPGIVDNYLTSKMKDEVKAQTSKIMTKVEKYVTETLGAEVLVRSTNQPQMSYAVASSLSELELKKILMDKMEENNSIDRSDVQKNLYRALLEAYNSDKDLLSSYDEVVTLKRGRDDQDKDKEPSARSNRRVDDLEEPSHQEFNTGNDDVSPVREAIDVDELLWNPSGSRTPDREWNKTKMFLSTPIDFSAFIMNRFNIQNLTQDVLTGLTYDLMKGTCKSVVELEYHLEEVFKATNDQLDWHNPKGRPYPHDLSKPLPLIPNARDKIPRSTWSKAQVVYDKHAYWGTYYWGPKRQRFYRYATNMETSKDVYSRHRIIAVTSLKIMEFFGYKHLEEITVRRQYDKLYKFREGDFKRLRRDDIEDMLLLLVQNKLTNLNVDEQFALNLVVERYQKKINLTKPDTYRSDISKKTPYTAYRDIQGIIYQDDMNRNCLMRTNELHKFSDGTLNHVRTSLNDIATGIQMDYLSKRKWSKQDKQRTRVMIKAIDKKLKDRRLMRSLEKFVGGRPYKGDLRLLQRTI